MLRLLILILFFRRETNQEQACIEQGTVLKYNKLERDFQISKKIDDPLWNYTFSITIIQHFPTSLTIFVFSWHEQHIPDFAIIDTWMPDNSLD